MLLNTKFYKEIYEKENMWINMLDLGLINTYYLEEIKQFYVSKLNILICNNKLLEENVVKKLSIAINNIIFKLNYFINEDKNGYDINLSDLKNLFLINRFSNNVNIIKSEKTIKPDRIQELYQLKKYISNEKNEDYTDDDFYYENQKVS